MHRDVAAKEFPIFSLKLFEFSNSNMNSFYWMAQGAIWQSIYQFITHFISFRQQYKIWYKIKIFAHIARKDCTIPNLSLPSVTVSTCWDFLITNIRITFLMSYFTIDLFFMIALLFTCWGIKPFEAPQRSVKIKIKLNFFSLFARDWDGRVNLGFS